MNPCFSYYRICLPLHLIFIKCSNVSSPNLHLSGLKVFPATLKVLSTGADVSGINIFCSKFTQWWKSQRISLPKHKRIFRHFTTWLIYIFINLNLPRSPRDISLPWWCWRYETEKVIRSHFFTGGGGTISSFVSELMLAEGGFCSFRFHQFNICCNLFSFTPS